MARLRNIWTLAAFAAGALGIMLSLTFGGAFGTAAATGASPQAAAATTTTGASAGAIFGCRASVARVVLAGENIAEPAVANDNATDTTTCNTDTAAVAATSLTGSSSALGNLGTVGPAGAYTYETGALGGATSPGVTSVTNVTALTLNLGGFVISAAGPLQSQASVECVGTTLEDQGSSDLNALTITAPGGTPQTIEIGGTLNQVLGNLGPLSALVSITANEETSTAGVLTYSLLDIKVLTTGAQIVVGESTVDYPNSAICAQNVPGGGGVTTVTTPAVTNTVTGASGTPTTITSPAVTNTVASPSGTVTVTSGTSTTVVEPSGSVPGYLQQCATGSVLDPTTGNCVIFEDGQTIFVSKPFKGPIGGTVVSLGVAKSEYKSPCLSGPGPGYVFLVKKSHENAYGTPQSDRILILGTHDHTAGLAGNDCMDGQGTTQKITDGNGADRDYVTKGTNRVIVGNGNDHVYGGNGKDWITAGTGSDTIYGGKLASRIDAYGNYKSIYGGPGNDRIWTNSIRAFIHCGKGTKNILFARQKIAKYGAAHGCEKIGLLK